MGLLGRVEIRGVVLFLIFRYRESYWILNVFSYVCNRNQLLLTQIICRYYVLKKDNRTVFLLLYAKRCKGAVWSNPYKLSSTERASREGSLRGVRSFYIYRFSTLLVRSVLLYSVLGVCLSLCLRATTAGV